MCMFLFSFFGLGANTFEKTQLFRAELTTEMCAYGKQQVEQRDTEHSPVPVHVFNYPISQSGVSDEVMQVHVSFT